VGVDVKKGKIARTSLSKPRRFTQVRVLTIEQGSEKLTGLYLKK
jgi:hypothetical protein